MTRDEFIKEIEERGATNKRQPYRNYSCNTFRASVFETHAFMHSYETQYTFKLPYSVITVALINAVAGERNETA